MLFYGYLQSFTGYFETNSSFRVKWRSPGRVWFLFLKSFLLVLLEFSFWRGGWALGYEDWGIILWGFEIFLIFPNLLGTGSPSPRPLAAGMPWSIKLFGSLWVNLNMFITNNRATLHLWWKENLVKHQKVSKYYENDCLKNFLVLFMS